MTGVMIWARGRQTNVRSSHWVSDRQLAHLRALMGEIGTEARQLLREFAGSPDLDTVARFMTRREADALIMLFSVLADTASTPAA